MRIERSIALALMAAAAFSTAAIAQGAEQDRRPGVAVFPFEDGGWRGMEADERAALGIGLQQLLLNELAQNQAMRIVERNVLRQILEEQDLAEAGRVDAGTAARIGRIVGARYVVLGTLSDLGGTRPTLAGRIVSVETSEVLRAEQVTGNASDLYEMVVDLATRVTTGVELPLLPAAQREARRAREIPAEALRLYSQAQVLQDLGRREQAIALYQRITREFPAMTEAQEALRQMPGPQD